MLGLNGSGCDDCLIFFVVVIVDYMNIVIFIEY